MDKRKCDGFFNVFTDDETSKDEISDNNEFPADELSGNL